jgi:phenylalanyl-tRNA synthetase alpha chain
MNELDSLVASAQALFAQSTTPADLENAKAQFLGKSGRITEMMKGMAALSVEEKKSTGAAINVAKQAIEAALTARRQALADAELETQLKAEALDVTLPGRARMAGGLNASKPFLARWVLKWPKAQRSKPTGSISPRSTRLKTIPHAPCTTPSM